MPASCPSIAAAAATSTTHAQPQPHSRATPTSPGVASSGGNGTGNGHAIRPPLMKRQRSQSSHSSTRPGLASPAASEQHLQHHAAAAARVKPRNHHAAKVVLPRNHSSARNLAKMSKQAQAHVAFDNGRRHARQRSHEGDTEIRLPGSLDESVQSRPAMKRNLTAYQLPRTQSQSQVKLKKNLSHGQLSRLGVGGSSRNLAGMGTRAPASPGLKGKSKRPKSAEITPAEYRALQERKGSGQRPKPPSKKVGFAVGSSDESGGYDDDEDDEDDVGIKQLDMEGSGLQEDEWTEESASASPYSTRQNTANNSRRTSMNIGAKERTTNAATPSDSLAAKVSEGVQRRKSEMEKVEQSVGEDDHSSDVKATSPRTMAKTRVPPAPPSAMNQQSQTLQQAPLISLQQPVASTPQQHNVQRPPRTSIHDYAPREVTPSAQVLPPAPQQQPPPKQAPRLSFAPPIYQQDTARGSTQLETHATAPPRSSLQQSAQQPKKEYANPAAKRVTTQVHLPSPAAVTNVSTLDSLHNKESLHSSTSSPAPSLRSSTSNLRASDSTADAEREDDELVSRFVPSTSHPSFGSGANTALNTPKQGSGFHTPEEHQHDMPRDSRTGVNFQLGPTSPGSTISNSSGHTTPAMGRSRTELRLLQEKALADMENRAENAAKPVLPGHVYDRRNESLKSFMSNTEQASGLSIGPQIFQGRFRAVNTELRVVQKFRDPIGEAITRLRSCKGSKLNRPSSSASVTGPGLTRASTGLNMSKSAVNLPSQRAVGALSKSASPPKISGELALKRAGQQTQVGLGGPTGGGSERQQSRRGVSFAGRPPRTREISPREVAMSATTTANGLSSADVAKFARELWHDS